MGLQVWVDHIILEIIEKIGRFLNKLILLKLVLLQGLLNDTTFLILCLYHFLFLHYWGAKNRIVFIEVVEWQISWIGYEFHWYFILSIMTWLVNLKQYTLWLPLILIDNILLITFSILLWVIYYIDLLYFWILVCKTWSWYYFLLF